MSITEHELEALDVIPAPRNKTGAGVGVDGGGGGGGTRVVGGGRGSNLFNESADLGLYLLDLVPEAADPVGQRLGFVLQRRRGGGGGGGHRAPRTAAIGGGSHRGAVVVHGHCGRRG